MGLLLDHSSTTLSRRLSKPHRSKLSPKMTVNVTLFWILAPPGASGNDSISKDSFLDKPFHLSLPRSANFADLIIAKGSGCFLFKKDLKCAYRQIPVDPRDYNLLGYHWNDLLYSDLVLPFGLHSATLTCQRHCAHFLFRLSSPVCELHR